MMRTTWVLLAFVLASFMWNQSEAHVYGRTFQRRVKTYRRTSQRRVKTSMFRGKGLICRIQRHRTIVDKFNKYVRCERRCPSYGYREMYSITWGHYCKPIVIPTGCSDEYCNRCARGYKWLHSFDVKKRCVKKCPRRYFSSRNKCQRCFSSDCDECSSTWKCSRCKTGFALYKTLMGSTVCLRRCVWGFKKQMVAGKLHCVRPTPPTALPTSSTTTTALPTTSTTTAPPTTMTTASESSPSLTTVTEDQPQTTTAESTTTTTTEATTTTTTSTTTQPPPEGCDDLYCTMCSEGFLKFITRPFGKRTCVKQCPMGYSASGDVCIACSDSRCGLCKASITECTECKQGFSLMLDATDIDAECVRYCPNDYVMEKINNASTCVKVEQKECPVTNCEECLESSTFPINRGCAQCKEGFNLFRGALTDHCYTSCPPGYYVITEKETNRSICARCQIPFCKSCSQSDTCDACVEPMVLDATTGKCRFCAQYTVFVYDLKRCVPININKPENINEVGVFGGPFVGKR